MNVKYCEQKKLRKGVNQLPVFKKNCVKENENLTDREFDLNSKRLYKEILKLIFNKNIFPKDESNELCQLSNQLQNDLISDGRKVFHTFNDVKYLVSNFRKNLSTYTQNDLDIIKSSMASIESSFREYRLFENTSMEGLIQNESQLWQDCSILTEKIQSWEMEAQTSGTNKNISVSKFAKNFTSFHQGLPKDVIDYQKFLSVTGGRTGGWAEFDHNKFVIVRRRYLQDNEIKTCANGNLNNVNIPAEEFDQFTHDVASVLCYKTLEAIAEHDAWFVNHQHLESAYKIAIMNYKIQKNERRNNRDFDRLPEVTRKRDTFHRMEQNSAKPQADIIAWREVKRCEADKKLEADLMHHKNQKLEADRKRKLRIEALHEKLEDFRLQKVAETAVRTKAITAHNSVKRVSQKSLDSLEESRIQERNLHILKTQSARKEALTHEKTERAKLLQRAQSARCVITLRNPTSVIGRTTFCKIRVQKEPKECTRFRFTSIPPDPDKKATTTSWR